MTESRVKMTNYKINTPLYCFSPCVSFLFLMSLGFLVCNPRLIFSAYFTNFANVSNAENCWVAVCNLLKQLMLVYISTGI